jgi:uncharacterized protein (TIGR02271 family)
MASDRADIQIREGMTVLASDGEDLGKVDGYENNAIIVREGFFFPRDHYIPVSAIAQADEDNVYLNVTRDAALSQGWENPIVGDGSGSAVTQTAGYDTASVTGTVSYDGDVQRDDQPFEHTQDMQRTHINEDDDILVPVHEEELTATTRPVERGAVRVEKEVVEEQQQLDVPVTEERVQVSRRMVDRDAAPTAGAFEEGTIEVPVTGEDVEVQKRARVREEVEIDREAVTETERVSGTVRREEVNVEGEDVRATRNQ